METERRAVNSAKTILRLEVKCNKLQQENANLKEEVMEAKGKEEEMKEKYLKKKDKYAKVKKKFYLEERKWREEEEKITELYWQLEGEKKKLEIDLKVAMRSRVDGSDDVAEKLKVAEAEAEALKRLFEEQDDTITTLLTKNESLERHMKMDFDIKMAMEAEKLKMEEEKVLVLSHKIQVLEGEKRELEAEVCRAKTEKSEEINTILNEKSALKEKHLQEISNLVSRTSVLEREKQMLEAETREKDERIKVLVQDKERVVAPEDIDVSDAEPKESSGLLGSKITKRKVQVLGCSVVNQAPTKYCKLDGLTERGTLQHRLEAQKEAEERITMLVQEKERLVGGVSSKKDVDLPQPVHPDTCNANNTSIPTKQNRVSSPSPATSTSSRYENQKRRDWNSFGKYLKNHKPDLTLSSCSGDHVREYLLYLDQFGKTKDHAPDCPFYGHPNPPDPCPCPIRQGGSSLDALTGRLRAAFEENGGKPEDNPFGTLIVRRYLLDIKNSQYKARGVSYMKKRKNPRNAANYHMPLAPPPASGTC